MHLCCPSVNFANLSNRVKFCHSLSILSFLLSIMSNSVTQLYSCQPPVRRCRFVVPNFSSLFTKLLFQRNCLSSLISGPILLVELPLSSPCHTGVELMVIGKKSGFGHNCVLRINKANDFVLFSVSENKSSKILLRLIPTKCLQPMTDTYYSTSTLS